MSNLEFGSNDPRFREIERIFHRMGTAVDRNANLLNEVNQRVQRLEQLAQTLTSGTSVPTDDFQRRMAEARDLIGTSTERMQKYLTAIIFGGYAAFFGFWTFLHGKVSEIVDALSGLLMLVSMVAFFGYEISKTIRYTWYLAAEYLRIPANAEAAAAADAFLEMQKRGRAMDERSIRATKHQTILSAIPASVAILTLGGGFAWHLAVLVSPSLASIWGAIVR